MADHLPGATGKTITITATTRSESTIHRTVCPACGYAVTAMSEAALFHGLMAHQEQCQRA